MFDLKIVVTPLLGLITFLTLINLKLTLKEPQFGDLIRYASKNNNKNERQPTKQLQSESSQQKRQFLKTLSYLIKNFTFLDIIIVRRARNKVPIFLTFFIQLGLVYFFGFSFYFSVVGIIMSLVCLSVKLIDEHLNSSDKSDQESSLKNHKDKVKNGRKLQVLMSTISLLLNMEAIWIFYKNFHNQIILSAGINLSIVFAIDNFAVKSAILALLSFPLSFSNHLNNFIDLENQIVQVMRKQKILQTAKRQNQQAKNPQKIFVSTSHTQNTLQIQPYVNLDPHQNVLEIINPSKRIQLQKITSMRKRPSKQYNGDNSSLSLFQSHLPIKQNNILNNISNLKSSLKNSKASPQITQNIDQLNNSSFFKKKTKVYTENVDFIDETQIFSNKKKHFQNDKNEDLLINTIITTPKSNKFLKDIKFTNSAKKTFEKNNQDFSNLKDSFEKDIDQIYAKTQQINDQNRSHCSYGSNFHGTAGKTDLLKIYEDKFAEDLGQINNNSPYKRRKPFEIKLDEVNVQSNHKKFSLRQQKNIILQQSNISHFPDYLQKTYTKETHQKKRRSFQQASDLNLSRKSDAFSKFSNDSRISKSFKRTIRSKDPIVRQNDQNRIPQFIIEYFHY